MKRYFIGFGVMMLIGFACQAIANPQEINQGLTSTVLPTFTINTPPSTPSPTVEALTSVPSATQQKEILFEDDFSNSLTNWSTGDDAEARLAIEEGAFHIQINTPQNLYWTTPGSNFSDVRVEVDGEKLSGPDSAEYGIICRYDNKNGAYSFYYLVIAGDHHATIVKVVNGEQQELSTKSLTFDAINGGNALNHIAAACIGNQLSLSVNGSEIFNVIDDSLASGDVGLIATTYDQGGIDVRFDHFVVTAP